MLIAWSGVLLLIAAGVLPPAAVATGAWRARQNWRRAIVFDLLAFVLVVLAAAAFTSWFLFALVPLSPCLCVIPAATKIRLLDTTCVPRGLLQARWPDKLTLMSPALLTVFLTAWLLSWHHTLVIAYGFSAADFRDHHRLLAGLYVIVALAFSVIIHSAFCRAAAGHARRLNPALLATTLFSISGLMRVLDWGTFYYSAGHVDDDFWASAFYRQSLGFASARASWIPVVAFLASLAAFLLLLRLADRFAHAVAGSASASRPAEPAEPNASLRFNALAAFSLVAAAHIAWVLVSAAPGPNISNTIDQAFSGIPEYKFLQPLVGRVLQAAPKPPDLDREFVRKLESAGIELGTVDPSYPLMKRSIHPDPTAPPGRTPHVPRGTNVIIILAESLSAGLLDESVHGVKGLTPNFDDLRARAFTFRRLYSADFPTIKGQIATLASFAFDHRGLPTTALQGNPLMSRYLFLSDVLRPLGYTTLHLQSDFGTFASTAAILRRHQYERVRSADDADLVREARHGLKKTWGLFDRDLFEIVTRTLQAGAARQPFFLTIATTDTHFPFPALLRYPGASGSELLNAVYNEDQAFGVFWQYFRKSPLAANTIVLVTADHALVRRAIRKGGADPKPSEFDYIAAMLYLPGNDEWAGAGTDVPCSQLDLAPTVLDVLGIDVPNPFLGIPIFSDRPRYPLVLGRAALVEELPSTRRRAVEAIGWTRADQDRYLALLRYLAVADRIRP